MGAVCWPYYLKSRDKPLKDFFYDTIALCPVLVERLKDAELVDDAWIVLDAAESDLLHPEPAELWWTVVGRQRSDIRLLANYPSEPWVN